MITESQEYLVKNKELEKSINQFKITQALEESENKFTKFLRKQNNAKNRNRVEKISINSLSSDLFKSTGMKKKIDVNSDKI